MSSAASSSHAQLKDYVTLYAYKLICIIMKMIDVRIVALLGRGAGYLVWALMPSRRRIVARNLRIVANPMLREEKLASMVRRNIVRTTMNLACSLKTGLMKNREMNRSIRVEGADIFEQHGMDGHTVVSCIPHAGNWEALARIRPLFKRVERFGSMYRRLSNPLLEEFVYKSRTRYGCEMFSKEEGLKEVLKLARTGGLLGVLSDQFTSEGVYIPYFGKVTGVTPLPALLYKRCKGKGHLHAVFTRNTTLGHWDAVLGRVIELPEGCESLSAITMQVNLALENCQRENILDGFWMHHRWKTATHFVPELDADARAAIAEHARLPFRIIVCMPELMDAAREVAATVKSLSQCRPDAQVSIVCPSAQAEYWRTADGVAHVMTSDGPQSLRRQFDADEVYQDGPFDLIFLFNDDKRLYKRLSFLFPLYVACWESHPMAHACRRRYQRRQHETPYPLAAEYAEQLQLHHGLH